MLLFKVLHVLAMFGAVTFLVSEAVYTAIAIWRGDTAALAALRRLIGRRPILAASLFVLGIAFGLLTAATGGFDFFVGWLIAAYVMVVAVFVMNGLPVVQKGLLTLTEHAVEAEAGQRSADEVSRRNGCLSWQVRVRGRAHRRALHRAHPGHDPQAVLAGRFQTPAPAP